MARKPRTEQATVRLMYDDGRGPETRDVLVPRRHCLSHAMRTLPYGARLLSRPTILREEEDAKDGYCRFLPDDEVVLARAAEVLAKNA